MPLFYGWGLVTECEALTGTGCTPLPLQYGQGFSGIFSFTRWELGLVLGSFASRAAVDIPPFWGECFLYGFEMGEFLVE